MVTTHLFSVPGVFVVRSQDFRFRAHLLVYSFASPRSTAASTPWRRRAIVFRFINNRRGVCRAAFNGEKNCPRVYFIQLICRLFATTAGTNVAARPLQRPPCRPCRVRTAADSSERLSGVARPATRGVRRQTPNRKRVVYTVKTTEHNRFFGRGKTQKSSKSIRCVCVYKTVFHNVQYYVHNNHSKRLFSYIKYILRINNTRISIFFFSSRHPLHTIRIKQIIISAIERARCDFRAAFTTRLLHIRRINFFLFFCCF